MLRGRRSRPAALHAEDVSLAVPPLFGSATTRLSCRPTRFVTKPANRLTGCTNHVAQTRQFSRGNRAKIEATITDVARGEPTTPAQLLKTKNRSWRRGWDSNPTRSFRFCKLQILKCRRCRKCQRTPWRLARDCTQADPLWVRALHRVIVTTAADSRAHRRSPNLPGTAPAHIVGRVIIAATLAGEKKSAGEIVPAFICTNLFIASWLP